MPSTATNRLQGLTTSVAVKAPVKVAASTNLTLSGEQTIAGVACADGDRVLAYGQSVPSENGIYVVSTGQWSRAKDFDGALDVVNGTLVVSNNTANDGIYYRVTTVDPIVIGTSNIEFEAIIGGLTQSIIGQLLYPQTEAESSAGVTPLYAHYPPPHFRRYGGVGDGVTDDTAAIQAALDVAAEGGLWVYVTDGEWAISKYLIVRNGCRGLIGRGGILKNISSSLHTGIMLAGIASGEAENVANCTISDLIIDMDGRVGNAIWAQNVRNCRVVRNTIKNHTYASSSFYGILLRAHAAGLAHMYENVIAENTVQITVTSSEDNPVGIELGAESDFGIYPGALELWKGTFTAPTADYVPTRNVIANNIVVGGHYGISLLHAHGTQVIGNILVGQVRNISAQRACVDNSIAGNLLNDSYSAGMHFAYGSSKNAFRGNVIYNTTGTIEAMMQAYLGCKNNVFADNKIYSAATPKYGAYCAVHADGNRIINNEFVGTFARAVIGVESAWRTDSSDPAHYATGGVGVDDCADVGTSGVEVVGNTIDSSSAIPAIYLAQISDSGGDYALSGVCVTDNRVKQAAHNYQMKLVEETASNLSGLTANANQFEITSDATKFLMPRGRAHFQEMRNNTVIDGDGAQSITNADTTPSVAVGRNFHCNNSGATSITTFDDGMDGLTISVRLDNNTTLVHNSGTMRLKGGVNLVGTSSDHFVTLRRLSGIWFEQGRNF